MCTEEKKLDLTTQNTCNWPLTQRAITKHTQENFAPILQHSVTKPRVLGLE